jgi:hypothetical protein
MPLVKSKSKQAFNKNVKAELAAGKPLKQSLAIAYSEKAAAVNGGNHHSSHSAKRSEHYHKAVVNPVTVGSGETKMTHAEYRNRKVTRG